ncbi:MAG: phosphotransferase family protein, partial [Sandarakinorhabdus sp.]|nr:phosphotransferase family protein [Sandarakinorhabdus sp.]
MSDPDRPAVAAALARAGFLVEITAVTALSGGAASATYAVEALRDGLPWRLILQCAPAPGVLSKANQAQLQMLGGRNGVPVANVVAILEPADGLGEGFVMERV